MMPRLRALLPRDAQLGYDGTEILLPRTNPTPRDLAMIRQFFRVAGPRWPERRDHVVHYNNSSKPRRLP